MPAWTLMVAGLVSLATASTFLLVALHVARRPTPKDLRGANLALGLWWGLLGGYLILQGALTIVAAYGALGVEVYLGSRVLAIPLLCGAVAALNYHLVFLYTGSATKGRALAWAYGPVALLFAYATFGQPQTLHVSAWLVSLDDTSLAYKLIYALVGIPPIVASLAYLRLLPSISEPLLRLRVRLVSLTIAAYVGSGLAARLVATDEVKFVTLVGFGLAAAVLVLIAYHPPRAIRERFEGDGRA